MKTKMIALISCCAMVTNLFSGCGDNTQTNGKKVDPDMSTQNKITLSWMIPTQQGITLQQTPLFKNICEKLNIEIELTELPVSQHAEKKKLLISSKQVPDIMSWVTSDEAAQYGPVGAFLELSQYLDNMPSFKEKVEATIQEDATNKYTLYTADNQMYLTPHYQVDPIPIFDFSYVKSAFDDVGTTNLDTWDDVYSALKKLKQKYPDEYPLGFRNNGDMKKPLELFVLSFTGGMATSLDYVGFDYNKKEFVFAPELDGYQNAVAFFEKLYEEKLIHPEYTVMDEQMLKTRVKKGKISMLADYVGGWTGVPSIMKDVDNKLVPLKTPQAKGQPKVIGRQLTKFDKSVGTVLNSNIASDKGKLGRCLQFLDYLYSDEFYDVQWHHPDVTDKVGDIYQYKDSVYDIEGEYQVLKDTYFPWSMAATFQDACDERPKPGSDYQIYRDEYLRGADSKELYKENPTVPFTQQQQTEVNKCISKIDDRYGVKISEFAEGKRPMSEWDDFVKELKDAGGTRLIELYNQAYAAIK